MQAILSAYNRLVEETDCSYQRYLYTKIDWQERLIGIKGARGVGKTTLLLQHIKLSFKDRSSAFYASLDHIWFSNHTLLDLADYLYAHGVTHLFLDEVHRYLTWVREIKNIYDSYPSLHIVFTGSSLLEINQAEADLSRRLRTYELRGLSFREYLALNGIAQISSVSLDEILTSHIQIASSLVSKWKLLPHFEKYIQQGYYPFFLETVSSDSYYERLQKVINTVINEDIPAVEKDINYETLVKAKRLLLILAQTVPYTPNISTLCASLSTTRNQLIRLLSLLERSALIRQLYLEEKKLKTLGKPNKILFDNPNLMMALVQPADKGTVRESFFAAMVSQQHSIHYPKQGDILVDGKYLFEIGGRNKGFNQISNISDSYVAADEIETGFGNKIPLWMFGLLY